MFARSNLSSEDSSTPRRELASVSCHVVLRTSRIACDLNTRATTLSSPTVKPSRMGKTRGVHETTPELRNRMVGMYEAGLGLREIAAAVNCSVCNENACSDHKILFVKLIVLLICENHIVVAYILNSISSTSTSLLIKLS